MKVLLVSTAIEGGGAANASLRLYLALKQEDVDVRLLVLRRSRKLSADLLSDTNIAFLEDKWQNKAKAKLAFVLERLEVLWHNGFNKHRLWQYSTASFGLELSNHEWVQWADVVHLQWINHGTLSLQAIKSIQELNKVLVWTLHDLWALTGLAHLPNLSKDKMLLFASEYAEQKALDLNRGGRKAFVYRKKNFIAYAKMNYVAVSSFVQDLARQLLDKPSEAKLKVIAPALDIEAYKTVENPSSSFDWYQADERYLLISAARLDDPIKGGDLLIQLAEALKTQYPKQSSQITLLLLGSIKEKGFYKGLGLKFIELGHIAEKERLQALYRLADITLSTSLFETFGLTLVESLAMGTPVVSFDCGGVRDIIRDGENGYLIPAYDCSLMAKQIIRLLEAIGSKQISSEQCQRSVLRFDFSEIAQQHIDYYQELLKDNA